jgi:hypothetical protein
MRNYVLLAILCAGISHVTIVQSATPEARVIAINVLLLPDERMASHARDLNRQLRTNEPGGFALDETHVPHISVLHEYVRSEDLPAIFGAVERIAARSSIVGRELVTKGVEHSAWKDRELSTLNVQKTSELDALQRDLIAALQSYRQAAGTGAAFYTRGDSSPVDASTIDYVATFVEKRAGDQFKPHITLGFSDAAFADRLKTEESEPRNFRIADIAVFQLGNIGTARKKLWSLSSD